MIKGVILQEFICDDVKRVFDIDLTFHKRKIIIKKILMIDAVIF